MTKPSLPELLHAAVTAVGGTERPGQVTMAEAVAEAIDDGSHLLVQAGTGTGKSLGYLVPALAHGERVVVATATLALQRQLVERDLPRTVDALHPLLRRRPEFAMLKGRSNYLCLHRLHEGVPQDEEEGLFDQFEAAAPTSKLGQDLLRLRDWSDETETGDRDDLTPGVSDRAWAQVSVSSRECLGATKCAYGAECFAEMARERAKLAEVVVTNHALLAIDAIEGAPVLPAARGADRRRGARAGLPGHRRRHRRAHPGPGQPCRAPGGEAGQREGRRPAPDRRRGLRAADGAGPAGPPGGDPRGPRYALMALRDAARTVISAIGVDPRQVRPGRGRGPQAGAGLGGVRARRGGADRRTAPSGTSSGTSGTTASAPPCGSPRMSVSGLLREKLFTDRSVVLTSATLKLGGDFNGVGASLGLAPEGTEGEDVPQWKGIDVGSPFDYPKQGILYVAKHLARPARDGDRGRHARRAHRADPGGRRPHPRPVLLDAGGAARRGGTARPRIPEFPILLQGEETLGELIKNFAADPKTCLFGTLSLWQGVDVPGPSCQLVVMDKIPFPRPDDPLMSARQKAVEEAGGNGFMAVAATHAALLMAQGAGRLVRASGDRGVVAVLDQRLATARYGELPARRPCPTSGTPRTATRSGSSLAAIDATAKQAEASSGGRSPRR